MSSSATVSERDGDEMKIRTAMANDYRIDGEVVSITLQSKKYGTMHTVIDLIDLPVAMVGTDSKWYVVYDKRIKTFYVMGTRGHGGGGQTKNVALHRVLTGATGRLQQVDHINHDGLCNRRFNLRITTHSSNQLNRRGPSARNKTSGILGVWLHRKTGKWKAGIRINKRQIHLGYFDTQEQATIALTDFRKAEGLPCQP